MTSPLYDVFVSHNGLDKPWVRKFVKYLRACDLRVFFDEDSIDYGADTVTIIDEAIENSAHVLLVISSSSLLSNWVALESSVSIYSDPAARLKKVIPIVLTSVPDEQIKLSIRRLNRVDLTREDIREAALQRLLKQLGVPEEKMAFPVWTSLLTEHVDQKHSESLYRFCQPAQEWYIPRNEEEFLRGILQDIGQSQNIVITGRTGFGKSSFLAWFERAAAAQGDLVVKTRPGSDQLGDFYETIKQHCLTQLESLDIGPPATKRVYSVDLDAILNRLTNTGKRLIILIDQFENLFPPASNVAARAVWQNITNTLGGQLHNPRIVWVFAVKEWYFLALFPSELSLKLVDATYISLSDLDHQQSTALVRRLASLTNVTISDPAVDLLVTKTGGRPLTLVLTFLVALEKSPRSLVVEYDYLNESQPWNEIFKADYDRLESHRQRLIVLALAHTRRELVSQMEIISKVARADDCSVSDVEADLKRIENEIGIITLNEGFVSFVHSAFGLYVDSKHYQEYPKTWIQQPLDEEKQTRDFDFISTDVTQRAIATIIHNMGTRLGAGPLIAERLKHAVNERDLKKAESALQSLEEWLGQIFNFLKSTSRLVSDFQPVNQSTILVEAISSAANKFRRDDVSISVTGLDSVGQLSVVGPQDAIEYLLSELFQNSVDANAMNISVHVKKDPESPLIDCQIADDGSGIPADQREKIFHAFYSVGRLGQAGFGLFFVKRLLESYGGTITVDGREGRGTRITLRFAVSDKQRIQFH